MNHIDRELERKFLRMNGVFKAVMVVGARQVGKSTMPRRLAEKEGRKWVAMNDQQARDFAKSDPKLFFQTFQPPILIDEAQKAPELFETIKIMCDNTEERGSFRHTGSQSRKLTRQAGDSLAGRVCVLKMYNLSQRELFGVKPDEKLDFSFASLRNRSRLFPKNNILILDTFEHIWPGGFPAVQALDEEQLREYFNSYIETYLMRDAVDDNGITDRERFRKFLRARAAFSGQLLNYNDLAASGAYPV